VDAGILAGFNLVTYVNLRGWAIADQNYGEARLAPLAGEDVDSLSDLRP
jgi:hypothetical protein